MLKNSNTTAIKNGITKDLTKQVITDLKRIKTPNDFDNGDIYNLLQLVISLKLMHGMPLEEISKLLYQLTDEVINDFIQQINK